MKEKRPVGKPRKYSHPDQMVKIGVAYFQSCIENKEPITVTGLAIALDTTRHGLMDYENRPEYSNAIKKLKTVCENYAEKNLYSCHSTGAIFALKNYGWTDKQQFEHLGKDGGAIDVKLEHSIEDESLRAIGEAIVKAKASDSK